VRQHCTPAVREIAFAGADEARLQPEFLAALSDRNLRAVVICPTNPFISVDPILAVPGVREALRACAAPVVAVSPIIGGKAVKGPTAKLMAELGLPVDAAAVARHYGDILDLYVADQADADELCDLGLPVAFTRTLMLSLEDREALARAVLEAAARGF
jgi:LPPG:FO 2-phospho-L-lactate transferase